MLETIKLWSLCVQWYSVTRPRRVKIFFIVHQKTLKPGQLSFILRKISHRIQHHLSTLFELKVQQSLYFSFSPLSLYFHCWSWWLSSSCPLRPFLLLVVCRGQRLPGILNPLSLLHELAIWLGGRFRFFDQSLFLCCWSARESPSGCSSSSQEGTWGQKEPLQQGLWSAVVAG